MNSKLRKKLRKVAISMGITLIGALALARLVGSQGLPNLHEKRVAITALREENRQLQEEVDATRAWVERLKHDPDARKQLVRERLQLTEEGVIDFKTPVEKPPAAEPAQ
jgi:cell division protein FtsB